MIRLITVASKLWNIFKSKGFELDTPTIAGRMPFEYKRRNGFSTTEPRERTVYLKLNRETPCPSRGAVLVHHGKVWGSFSFQSFRFAFSNGGDHSVYVGWN